MSKAPQRVAGASINVFSDGCWPVKAMPAGACPEGGGTAAGVGSAEGPLHAIARMRRALECPLRSETADAGKVLLSSVPPPWVVMQAPAFF